LDGGLLCAKCRVEDLLGRRRWQQRWRIHHAANHGSYRVPHGRAGAIPNRWADADRCTNLASRRRRWRLPAFADRCTHHAANHGSYRVPHGRPGAIPNRWTDAHRCTNLASRCRCPLASGPAWAAWPAGPARPAGFSCMTGCLSARASRRRQPHDGQARCQMAELSMTALAGCGRPDLNNLSCATTAVRHSLSSEVELRSVPFWKCMPGQARCLMAELRIDHAWRVWQTHVEQALIFCNHP